MILKYKTPIQPTAQSNNLNPQYDIERLLSAKGYSLGYNQNMRIDAPEYSELFKFLLCNYSFIADFYNFITVLSSCKKRIKGSYRFIPTASSKILSLKACDMLLDLNILKTYYTSIKGNEIIVDLNENANIEFLLINAVVSQYWGNFDEIYIPKSKIISDKQPAIRPDLVCRKDEKMHIFLLSFSQNTDIINKNIARFNECNSVFKSCIIVFDDEYAEAYKKQLPADRVISIKKITLSGNLQ